MSDALDRVCAAAKQLKVFPLPSVVLLPGTAQPLHIFEQRYRDMIRDALASDGVFAMAGVLPGFESELAGSPALEPIVCAGVISLHEALEDGRYDLVVVGICRARIIHELPHSKLYREFEVEMLPDAEAPADAEKRLQSALMDLIARVPQSVGQKLANIAARSHGGALADVLTGTVINDIARRYEVLNELDVGERMRRVTDDLRSIATQLRPTKREGLMN